MARIASPAEDDVLAGLGFSPIPRSRECQQSVVVHSGPLIALVEANLGASGRRSRREVAGASPGLRSVHS